MPTIVAYGAGTNSTALLIGMVQKREPADLILFADTGGERPETYEYVKLFNQWLIEKGMPGIITVKKVDYKGDILTLEENCLQQKMLPSLAYGFKTCSQKFKVQPQDKYCNNWEPAKEAWSKDEKCIKLIGYDADEPQRAKDYNDRKYEYSYSLIEWDWGRKECERTIQKAGLPLPGKSSCFFCPSMKKHEIFELKRKHPNLLTRAIAVEENAELTTIPGLGRNYSWKSLIEADERQIKMFCDVVDTPCGCYDGGD